MHSFSSCSLDHWSSSTSLSLFFSESNPFCIVSFSIRLPSLRIFSHDEKLRSRHQRAFNTWWQDPLENRTYVYICTRETSPMKKAIMSSLDLIERSRSVHGASAFDETKNRTKSFRFLRQMCSSFAKRFLLVRRFTFKWPMSSHISTHLNCNIVRHISIAITV